MTQPLTPAAERKRQQRARAASGQVHRVAVYLTEEELKALNAYRSVDETHEDAIRFAIMNVDTWGYPCAT